MINFAVVGTGWRTEFYLRVAAARPDLFRMIGVVSRNPERAARWARPFGIPIYGDIDSLLRGGPDFVVTSVPWAANPEVVAALAERGMPTLSETPPAPGIDDLRDLSALVDAGAKIAVAEQFHLQPHHAARIRLARSGLLGEVSQAQVSVAHGYHGISLLRRLLGVGYEDATITARRFVSPIVPSPDRSGPPATADIVDSEQVLAWFDFGGRLGVYDFTVDQYFSHVRHQRVLVRGERGEIIDDEVSYLRDGDPVGLSLSRFDAGPRGSLDGLFLKGIRLGRDSAYDNPLAPARLTDEEIAVGTALLRMSDYVAGEPAFYSLAEACQDRYLEIMMWQAVDDGAAVSTQRQPWSSG